MLRRAFSPYATVPPLRPRRQEPKDGGGAHAGRDVSGEMSRGMSPAASCRVDDKLSYKLNTSGMKMHYPSARPSRRRWTATKLKEDFGPGKLKGSERTKRVSRFLCAATSQKDFLSPRSRASQEPRNLFSRISGWSWRSHLYSIYGWKIDPLYRISLLTIL